MENAVLTPKEAASILRVSSGTVYMLIRENKIPHVSVGTRRKVIPAKELYSWLDSHVIGG